MQKRNVLNSPRLSELKKRRRRAVLNKILISFLGFFAILASLIYISNRPSLNISEINIVGNKVLDVQTLKNTVQKQLTGKYLWFFSKTNILLYPESKIKSELKNKFKRIQDVNLSVKDNQVLMVSLNEREAKYTWCGQIVDFAANQDKCYFLDQNGYIFDEAPYFSGEVYFKFYGMVGLDDSGTPLGSYFSKENFTKLILFKDTLINMGLKPFMLSTMDNGDVELYLSTQTTKSTYPKIIFNINADLQNVAENLQAALTTEPLQSKFKNKYSSLEYIDLRFGNKVYDKFSS